MRTLIATISITWIGIITATGCGSNSGSSSESPVSPAEVQETLELTQQVQSALDTYRSDMMAGDIGPTDCPGMHDAYYGTVRPWLVEMGGRAPYMDGMMSRNGGGMMADYDCLTYQMQEEFERHHQDACAGPGMEDIQYEVDRHWSAMMPLAGWMESRCGEILRGQNGEGWDWEPRWDGCQAWDGTCGHMMMGCDDRWN